jgi:hypothetical protein
MSQLKTIWIVASVLSAHNELTGVSNSVRVNVVPPSTNVRTCFVEAHNTRKKESEKVKGLSSLHAAAGRYECPYDVIKNREDSMQDSGPFFGRITKIHCAKFNEDERFVSIIVTQNSHRIVLSLIIKHYRLQPFLQLLREVSQLQDAYE